jgi:hypothetical protein
VGDHATPIEAKEREQKMVTVSPALKVLGVGHTGNVGTLPFDMDLSQRRSARATASARSG